MHCFATFCKGCLTPWLDGLSSERFFALELLESKFSNEPGVLDSTVSDLSTRCLTRELRDDPRSNTRRLCKMARTKRSTSREAKPPLFPRFGREDGGGRVKAKREDLKMNAGMAKFLEIGIRAQVWNGFCERKHASGQ